MSKLLEKLRQNRKTYRIGDLCSTIFSGGTPNTMNAAYWNGNIPWLSSGETGQDFINDTFEKITKAGVDNSSTRMAKKGDIVMATAGQGHTRGQTSFLNIDTYINQSIIALRVKQAVLDNKYLYYNLKLRYPELRALSDSSSSRGSITCPMLAGMEIDIPDLPTQKKIAEILGAYDEKIENNNLIIKNLEAMAQAIFNEWFVKFRFPGYKKVKMVESELGLIPEGWEVRGLDEIADFLNGVALQKFPPKNENAVLPAIKIREMNSGVDSSTEKVAADIDKKYIIKNGDVLFSWSGSLELMEWFGGDAALNQHIFKVTSEKFPKWFFYAQIKRAIPFFRVIASGKATTMGHIQRHHLTDYKIVVPHKAILDSAGKILDSLFLRAANLKLENIFLKASRDQLLKRLI